MGEIKYLVVLADRMKAKFLIVSNGFVENYEEIVDKDVPQDVKAKKTDWGRYDKISRHIENHVHRHFQRMSRRIDEFVKEKPIKSVIIGGHKPLFHKIERSLNPMLRRKLADRFTAELKAPHNEIVEKIFKTIRKLNQNLN